jgi:hypothetical protein
LFKIQLLRLLITGIAPPLPAEQTGEYSALFVAAELQPHELARLVEHMPRTKHPVYRR